MATTPKRSFASRPAIKSRRGAGAAVLLLLLAGCADGGGTTGGHCVMRESAVLPVLSARKQAVVRATINGEPVAFIVDTGAPISIVNLRTADRLGLPVDEDHFAMMGGTGGRVLAYRVQIDKLGLGHAEAHHVEFWRVDAEFGTIGGLPIAGLFGADFLSNYDVLFDLPAKKIGLFQGEGCGGDIQPPLADPSFAVPMQLDAGNHVRIPIAVDGHPLQAILDSGAFHTTLNMDDARAVGVTQAMLDADPRTVGTGIDGRHKADFFHEFRSFVVGDETRSPARLLVSEIATPTLVGDEFFRTNQVWISYPHATVFVHPVGPVTVLPPEPTPATVKPPTH